MSFIKKETSVSKSFELNFDFEKDLKLGLEVLAECQLDVQNLPKSSSIVLPKAGKSSSKIIESKAANKENIISEILSEFKDVDMAGIFVNGPVSKGVANSKGLKHWFSSNTFYLDYSLYSAKQKAVKNCYADSNWESSNFKSNVKTSIGLLQKMDLPQVDVKPGKYKTYLAPSATFEIIGTLNWGALGISSYKKGSSALTALIDGKEIFSEKFSLQENFELGLSPSFNSLGEVRESQVNVIEKGRLASLLVSSESAEEYGNKTNFANEYEGLDAPMIGPGELDEANVLKELGTGLYISYLHYLNWSDRMSARVTGMTRFACFWVENGEIVGPIKDLRFDESLYNCFGSNLLDLTKHLSVEPVIMTYGQRHIGGGSTPGILVKDFNFTL